MKINWIAVGALAAAVSAGVAGYALFDRPASESAHGKELHADKITQPESAIIITTGDCSPIINGEVKNVSSSCNK